MTLPLSSLFPQQQCTNGFDLDRQSGQCVGKRPLTTLRWVGTFTVAQCCQICVSLAHGRKWCYGMAGVNGTLLIITIFVPLTLIR